MDGLSAAIQKIEAKLSVEARSPIEAVEPGNAQTIGLSSELEKILGAGVRNSTAC